MPKLYVPLIVLLFSGLALADRGGKDDHDRDNRAGAGRQKDWNPFQNPFSFEGVANAPAGFGQFPSFGSINNNNRNGFGSFGSFGQPQPQSSNSGGGRDRTGDRPGGNVFGSWQGFQDFSPIFTDFQNQFGAQFPSFFPAPAPVVVVSDGDVATTAQTTTASTTTSTTTTTTSTAFMQRTNPPAPTGQSFVVTMRNCTNIGSVIGLSQSITDPCGSVECECFQGVYFCYSTCTPPPAGQSCTPTIPTGGSDVCPQYSNCSPQANSTMGASEIFRCNGAIHPSVCWLYEILYGRLTEPLGFFESQAQGCPLSKQCICGTNGFVQPAPMKQEDFKTPASNTVYSRLTPGRKGAFASSN